MSISTEQRAFEAFLRHGRALEARARAQSGLHLKALGDARPTNHYTWRTAHDEKVRSTHAANSGRIFSWTDPPATGHPGHERNCRCWAEPYYGTPAVLDATLQLRRRFEVDTSGREHWASVEAYPRPDGSLARSTISLRDGAQIQSTFAGASVTHRVQLPNDREVRVERRNGVQSILAGRTNVPIIRSAWTPTGPRMALSRQRVAQVVVGVTPADEFDEIQLLDPSRLSPPPAEAALAAAAAGLALLGLYNLLAAKPEALGAGNEDVAAVAFRAWRGDRAKNPTAIALTALTAEQVAQSCKRLPDVQVWTNEAVAELAALRTGMTAQQWGTAVHRRVETELNKLKAGSPQVYRDVEAEVSIDPDDPRTNIYGRAGSTRLDILEVVNEGLVCVYDVKTGSSGLTPKRVGQIAAMIALRYGPVIFFIIEVRPVP